MVLIVKRHLNQFPFNNNNNGSENNTVTQTVVVTAGSPVSHYHEKFFKGTVSAVLIMF